MSERRDTRARRLSALGGIVGLIAVACAEPVEPVEPAAPSPPPDVVLIVLDTLRPDHLELLGYERTTAPFLAEVGARGAVFPNAHSTSAWTPPATASIFTGLYPTGHGVVDGFAALRHEGDESDDGPRGARLPGDRATLPESLRDAGYATLGAATNPHINHVLGFDRGFDRFLYRGDEGAVVIVDWVIRQAEQLRTEDRPSFLYIHLNDIHAPYTPHAAWYDGDATVDIDAQAAYDSEIAFVDAQLRRLSNALDWDADTLLVIASDHGEAFGEHGIDGHQRTLYHELNRVLLLVAGAGIAPATIDVNVSLVDVAPTILSLIGAEPPESDGRSLAGLLRGDPGQDTTVLRARPVFAHRREHPATPDGTATDLWAVRRGPWRLIEDASTGERLLFDVTRDPLEQSELAADEPEVSAELGALLEAFRARGIRRDDEASSLTVDDALLSDLRAMGYAGGSDSD